MKSGWKSLGALYRRELLSYATTPTAYVFVAVFLLALGIFTFQAGRLIELGRADLSAFFVFHPWIYMIFLPAISMRLWSEEIASGTVEVLMTLPAPTWALVAGKFLAAWTIAAGALFLTFPLWITINALGHPDNGAILASYSASVLMAGGYLAIGSATSALNSTQVVAFVTGALLSFLFTAAGLPLVLGFFRGALGAQGAQALGAFSILEHFDAAQRGVLELSSLYYFVSLIALFLGFTVLAVDARRGG